MFISILIFVASIIPSILIFLLLRNRRKQDVPYRKTCNSAFFRGLIAVLPILGVSAVLYILNIVLHVTILKDLDPLIYKAMYTFIVLAFAEELVKFIAFRLLLKKNFYPYSWADVVAFMVIIGTIFGLVEDIPYAIGASPIVMLIRGFTMGHAGYGFLMGWFYGKRLESGKKGYGILAFVIPFLLHGLYDFSLSPELLQRNDNLAFIGISLAALDVVLIILMIRFFIRAKKRERYNLPLKACDKNTENHC